MPKPDEPSTHEIIEAATAIKAALVEAITAGPPLESTDRMAERLTVEALNSLHRTGNLVVPRKILEANAMMLAEARDKIIDLRDQLEEQIVLGMVSRNPGIDIDAVRAARARARTHNGGGR